MKMQYIALLLLPLLLLSQDAQVPADRPTLSAECEAALLETMKGFPGIDGGAMLAFYRENAPDLVTEWERRCSLSIDKGVEYTRLLANNFSSIEQYRIKAPEEYSRLVRQQKNESSIRAHSRKIQELSRLEKPTDEDKANLDRLKAELKTIMEDSFDEAQRHQQLEINRLENNLRELKALAEQRAANKQSILRQRFILLTGGQEWPK